MALARDQAGYSIGHRAYLLSVLSLLFAFTSSDRVALGLMLQSIKLSLSLTDLQLGVLNGIAFALFYSVMGIPIGLWADRGNRVAIISIATAAWTVMMSASSAAANFAQLLLLRVGVAVGEAGCVPPAHSLMADYFARPDRARAAAIYYSLGGVLSTVIGDTLAGWVNEAFGWRVTFLVLGVPGIVLTLLAWRTLREPRYPSARPHSMPRARAFSTPIEMRTSFFQTIRALNSLWHIPTFRSLAICFAMTSFFGYGIVQWQPTFFIRSYGLTTAELGMWFMGIYGIFGTAGMLLGGDLAARFAKNQEHIHLLAIGALYALLSLVTAFVYITHDYLLSFGLMAFSSFCGSSTVGPLFGALQTVVPERSRALSIAALYLAGNLIGMGFGPLLVGFLSDLLHPTLGRDSLRYALLAMCPGYGWGAWYFWRASTTFEHDFRRLQAACHTQPPPPPA